ncbi:MAG: hypothetical protein R3D90_04585 [Paracoccaceae bacterium]
MIPYSGSMVTLSSLCRSGSALSRPMLGLVMALVLALASILTMAERLRAEGAMQVVLCGTPGVEEVITLDAEGRPVTPVHHCPDCLVLTAAPGPAVPRLQLRAQMRVARFAPVLSRPSESLSPPPPAARGPPLTA